MLIQIGGWEILPTLVRPTSPSGLNECWTGLGSSRMFGIVLFWFVKLLIIYRLLQQTSKIYSLSWTAQNCSTLKMVKYPPRRSWTKLFKPVLAYKPSNGASFWWLLLRYFLVLSILIVTATVARVGASRASSYDGDRTVPALVRISSGYQPLLFNWSLFSPGFSVLKMSHAVCLALKTMPRVTLTSEASAKLVITEPRRQNLRNLKQLGKNRFPLF